jgi:hypothetical protein
MYAVRSPDDSVGSFDPTTGALDPLYSGLGLSAEATREVADVKTPWAVGLGALWIGGRQLDPVTLGRRGVLTRIDLSTGQTRFKTVMGEGVDDLAVDPSTGLWALDQGQESLRQIDPSAGHATRVISLHHFPCCGPQFRTGGIAVGHGRIWVAIQSP